MNSSLHNVRSSRMEAVVSSAYPRILRASVGLSVAATIAATVLSTWRSGLGLALGSLIAYLNLVWLHHGSELMIQRMIASAEGAPSTLRIVLTFAGRYVCGFAMAYVILKSSPRMFVGFMVGLVFPIIAAMGEGIYEAVVNSTSEQAPD